MEKENIKAALHEYRHEVMAEKEQKEYLGYVSIEILIISIILGVYFESWFVFGAAWIGLNICYFVPYLGVILSIGLSAVWGYLLWILLGFLSSTAGMIGGIIAFVISLGIHLYPKMD